MRGRVEFCWLRLRVPAMPDAPLHASWNRNSRAARGFARGSRLCCARSVCRGTEDAASLVSWHSFRPSLAATSPVFARRHLNCHLVPRSPPPQLSSRPSLAATSPVFSSLARRRLAPLLPQAWPAAAATPCEEGCLPLHSACAAAPPEVIAEVAAASRCRPAICRSYNIRAWPPPAGTAPRLADGGLLRNRAPIGPREAPLRGASPLY